MVLPGELKYVVKSCPIATLSSINPTWTGLGLKLGFSVERPVTNSLSHDVSGVY